MIKAFDMTPDLRRIRTATMLAHVMQIVDPYLCDHDPEINARREIDRALYKLFFESGVDFITDIDRTNAGLPPRDERGLTTAELLKIEQARLDAMYRPMAPFIVKKPPVCDACGGTGKRHVCGMVCVDLDEPCPTCNP